jgi:hypothetical protein
MVKGQYKLTNNSQISSAEFIMVPRRSKHKNFAMLHNEGCLKLASLDLGAWSMRVLFYLLAYRKPHSGLILPASQITIAKDLNTTQATVSKALKQLFHAKILYTVDVEEEQNIAYLGTCRWKISSDIVI